MLNVKTENENTEDKVERISDPGITALNVVIQPES